MIYFIRGTEGTTQIAIAETPKRAAALRAQGWRETSRDIYMAWWTHFDNLRLWEWRRAIAARQLGTLATRVVGKVY